MACDTGRGAAQSSAESVAQAGASSKQLTYSETRSSDRKREIVEARRRCSPRDHGGLLRIVPIFFTLDCDCDVPHLVQMLFTPHSNALFIQMLLHLLWNITFTVQNHALEEYIGGISLIRDSFRADATSDSLPVHPTAPATPFSDHRAALRASKYMISRLLARLLIPSSRQPAASIRPSRRQKRGRDHSQTSRACVCRRSPS